MTGKPDFSSASSEDVLRALGERLEALRLARNLTRDELAAEAGVSLRTLSRLAAGHAVSLDTFVRVMKALGLMDNLAALLPEPSLRPIDRVRLGGKERQRARRRRTESASWQWVDADA